MRTYGFAGVTISGCPVRSECAADRIPASLRNSSYLLAGGALLLIVLRLGVEHREEERELIAGLFAGGAKVGALEDSPKPQHGLDHRVVVQAQVVDAGVGDGDSVLGVVRHPLARHLEADHL